MKFSISILALDNLDLTRRCVESVFRTSNDFELLLTDNGSTDGTFEYFKALFERHSNVEVFHNDRNLGFQIPNAHALEHAQGEFFVMLNNDAEVTAGWLDQLEQPFKQFPSAALSGPVGACCGLRPDFTGYPSRNFEYLEGSCLMCKTSIVREHGLFSPYLEFAYGEDSDLSLRMRELGYSIHQAPFTIVHHRASTSSRVPNIKQIQERNHAALRKRWAHYLKVRKFDYPIVLRRKGALGDVLLVSAVARALRRTRPLSPVCIHTQWPDLFSGNPDVSWAGANGIISGDALVFDLEMAYENRTNVHIVDAYADVCGLGKIERKTFMAASPHPDCPKLPSGHWCAIHPGPSHWPGKWWPPERFQEIINRLRSTGWLVTLVGTDPRLRLQADHDSRGTTSPAVLASVLKSVHLFVGIDSFPLHCAQAVGTPAVGIFGATLPEFIMTDGSPWIGVTANPEIPCAGERHRVAGSTFTNCSGKCIRSISVDSVMAAIEQLTNAQYEPT